MPRPTALHDNHRRRAFAGTISFDAFVGAAQGFTAELRADYAATQLDQGELALLSQIGEPIDVLAIIEDSRPDSVGTLPVLARIEAETGKVRLHILLRKGSSQRPMYVFSDQAGAELGIIAPPATSMCERAQIYLDAFFSARAKLEKAVVPPRLAADDRAKLLESALQMQRDLRHLERASLVLAIGELAAGNAS